MLAMLRVAPLLPSPTLRAAANGPQVGTGKQAQSIELESGVRRGAAWPPPVMHFYSGPPMHLLSGVDMPVMTGGVGHAELRQFYATHFIPKMPPDMEMTPLSRTIGPDQLVDEMVVRFTHTIGMDWMLPGIAPTGKRV